MSTVGINVLDNMIKFTFKTFKEYASKPYQIADFFKENMA